MAAATRTSDKALAVAVDKLDAERTTMPNHGLAKPPMTLRWMVVFGALLAGAGSAAAGDKTDVVRDLAGRVGPIVGSALACRDIARPRIQVIVDKFAAVITEASSNEAERSECHIPILECHRSRRCTAEFRLDRSCKGYRSSID